MKFGLTLLLGLLFFSSAVFAYHDDIISELVASKKTVDKHAVMVSEAMIKGRPLKGSELAQINESASERLILRNQAYEFFSKSFYLVEGRIKKDFTLSDEELKELMLGLSVAVTLFDTTLYTYYKFHDNPKIRRLLNEKDSAYRREGNTFEQSVKGIFSLTNSIYLQRAIKIYTLFYVERRILIDDPELEHAHKIIQASFLYNNFKNRKTSGTIHDYFRIIGTRIKINAQAKSDFFNYIANSILYNGSRL